MATARPGREEVAETAAFLLGPGGRAFTGAPVVMDLGWTARYASPARLPLACASVESRAAVSDGRRWLI